MNNAVPLLVVAGALGAYVLNRPRKRSTQRPERGPVIVLDDPEIDEIVPTPSQAHVVSNGTSISDALGAVVDWWVSEYKGGFGWEYRNPANDNRVMSYANGLIYHYRTSNDALEDLHLELE